ncbi:3-oxoacyl-ACP reductase FabG [Nocardiopsis dassonvillei]|uniref:3-oxoacyl-ACP reductase FabG n=1 Tax=Nocardiopsis dassonvillei TaxID=2014 RepID=UPI000B9D6722|nr:3-oxoacyl-ACP reductase FabG [Nocardiopsis dassonvillei]ASU58199.1 beta-ketoacyl-ACP reductase [Nocardiopsis dassonvillei]
METTERPVALVTGGTKGIGRAVCLRLAEDGYDVALCYSTDVDAARELEKELTEYGVGVYARRADVSDPREVQLLLDAAQDALGPVSALVASAAVVRDTPLALMEDEDWQRVLRVDLDGVYTVCRAVIEEMMGRRHGAIVTLSSLAGILGSPGQTNYAAAKAGVIGFTTSLALEVGRYGIRANVVAPGYINTRNVTGLPEETVDEAVDRTALGRLGEPEEVADLVAFALSDRASYITGSVLRIDGGFGASL